MNKLKSIISVGIVFLSLSGMAQKHEGQGMSKDPAERAKMQTEKMTEQLKLSDTQQKQIAEINYRNAKEMQVIHDGSEDRDAAKDEIKKLRKRQDGEIKAVLDEKQNTLWEEHKQKRRQQMHQKQQKQAAPESK